jgi:hypothetical protein
MLKTLSPLPYVGHLPAQSNFVAMAPIPMCWRHDIFAEMKEGQIECRIVLSQL